MITRGSWRAASPTASSSSRSGPETFEIPTLEPSREGFTHSGRPIALACSRQPSSPTSQKSTCGMPWKASRRLKTSLSMRDRGGQHARARRRGRRGTRGGPGRCRPRRTARAGPGRPRRSRAGRPPARSSTSSPAARPAPVALDQDLDDLVAGLAQALGDRVAGAQRDRDARVERPPLITATRIRASRAWWWSSACVVVGAGRGRRRLELADEDGDRGRTWSECVPAGGAWSTTSPSWLSSVVVCLTTLTLANPFARRSLRAWSSVWPTTFGHDTDPAPFETMMRHRRARLHLSCRRSATGRSPARPARTSSAALIVAAEAWRR